MDDSMDIDIDLGDGIDYSQVAENGMETTITTETSTAAPTEDVIPDAYRDDFDSEFPAREKLHIKGLNHVAQPVVYQYIEEHAPQLKFRRLEWIDDDSANIVYHKPEDAAAALAALSVATGTLPAPLDPRPGRPFAARPDLHFTIRQALVSDKKKPGAKDRSAFYLFNPDWDPEQRKGERGNERTARTGRGGRGYRQDRPRDGYKRPARPVSEKQTFTEDMYDDAPPGQGFEEGELLRRMSSASLSSGSYDQVRRKRRYEETDLFEGKRDAGRLRDRSRSPLKDGDGRYGFTEDQPRRKTARRRSWTPPERRDGGPRRKNEGRDLFADREPASTNTPLSNGSQTDLFPNHSAKRSRELFPHKTAHSNHRRTDALDRNESKEITTPRALTFAERISGGPDTISIKGRGAIGDDAGFAIRGAGQAAPGFSIKGASKELNPKVVELFPNKVPASSNAGKELFPDVRGRGAQRRRAEDMFD